MQTQQSHSRAQEKHGWHGKETRGRAYLIGIPEC